MKRVSNRKAGLVWPEVLFVLSVVLLIVSISLPAVLQFRTRARSIRTYSEMKVLINATKRYNLEYRVWPIPEVPQRGDTRYGERIPNRGVLNILRAVPGPGNAGGQSNPSGMNFLALVDEPGVTLQIDAEGDVLDPWGSPYQIVLDANYDNICTIPESTYGSVIGTGVIVWSMGPDRKSDTGDDLLSWRL